MRFNGFDNDLVGFFEGCRIGNRICALAALIGGFLMGLFRLAVDTPVQWVKDFHYAEGSFLWYVHNIYFQYYSLLIFLVSVVVAIGGIDAATGRPLVDAGCHALAVITAILAAPDVRSAAADLAALFREAR